MFEKINITESLPDINFTISAGATRSFDLTIIDDNILEYYYDYPEHIYIDLLVYGSDGGRDICDSYYIIIEDNEGKTDN